MSYTIKLIEPQILELSQNRKNFQVLNSLIDLDIQNDEELKSLGPEYMYVLEHKDSIVEKHNRSPKTFDRLIAVITELYIDFNKSHGGNMKLKIPELIKLINDYKPGTLASFMTGEATHEF